MLEIEWAGRVVAGAGMRDAEGFRPGPGLERRLALPDRVRGIERVVLGLRSLEQVELDEARDLVQLRVAAEPDALERLFRSALHPEPIHRDEHGGSPFLAIISFRSVRSPD